MWNNIEDKKKAWASTYCKKFNFQHFIEILSLSQWRIPRLTMWLMTYKWRKISHLRKYLCRWMYPRVLWCLHTRRHAWNVGDLSNLESPIPLLTLWNLFPIFISYFWEVHMYAWFLCLQHKTEAIGKGLVYATTTKNCLRTLTND